MRVKNKGPSVPIALTFAILFNFAIIVVLFLYSDRKINTLTEKEIEIFRLLDTWDQYEATTVDLLFSTELEEKSEQWENIFVQFETAFNNFNRNRSFQKLSLRNEELDTKMSSCLINWKQLHSQVQEIRFWLNYHLESAPDEIRETSLLNSVRLFDASENRNPFFEETLHLINEIERTFKDYNNPMETELRSAVNLLTTEIESQADEIRLLSLVLSFSVILITVVFIIYGQRSIRSSEERFKHTVEYSPYPIAMTDVRENIEYVNPQFVEVFGYTLEDISTVKDFLGKAFLTEDSLSQIQALWSLPSTQGKDMESSLLDVRCKDNSVKHVSFRLVHIGSRRRFIFCEDMTSRIRAERSLVETNDALNAILEAAPLPIFALDKKGRVDYLWNPAAERLLGWKREEVLGKPLPTVSWEDKDDFLNFIDEVQSGEVLEGVEVRRKKKDGSSIDYGIYSAPLHDASGEVIGSVSLLLDLTEFKRNKQEREDLISELEAKNMELERFTYTVSHDLKSPLITIKGFLGLLEEDIAKNDSQQIRGDLGRINMAAEKMQTLLKELLELSRIGRQTNPPEDFSMNSLAQEVVETLEGVVRESGANISVCEDMPEVTGDRPRVFEILQNLIENAIKYSDNGHRPEIEVGCRRDGDDCVYYVKDNGIGIEEQYREKIFGLFEKLDRNSEGTGVGLALVKRIVDVHNGGIWVESNEKGSGSVFCFTLPTG